jgi:hypothetical protein
MRICLQHGEHNRGRAGYGAIDPEVENKAAIVCTFVRTVATFALPLYITIEVTKATYTRPDL